jgi:hypothetical protein
MRSIRWSALFLSLAAPLACAPHYDVGDSDGSAASGSGDDGSGGRSMTGGSGGSGNDSSGGGDTGGSSGTNGSGGKGATGGSGGSGETGGSDTGGPDATGGTGGSPVAGAGGGPVMPPPEVAPCGEPAEFEYATLATPEIVWERISQFLFGEVRDAPEELPEETTPEWAVEMLRAALDRSRISSDSEQTVLIPFMRKFLDVPAAGAGSDPPDAYWARMIGAPDSRLSVLFAGDQESNPPFGLFGTVAAQYESISHRGAFLASRLFCRQPDPGPFESEPVVVGPDQTRREALSAELHDPVCAGCHSVIDPPAFPLEVLTPGTLEYRSTENGKPIDTSGGFENGLVFPDIVSMGEQLSVSCDVARCLAQQLFDEAVPGGDPSVGPTVQLNNAVYRFAAPDSPEEERFQFQALLEAIVSSPAFLE